MLVMAKSIVGKSTVVARFDTENLFPQLRANSAEPKLIPHNNIGESIENLSEIPVFQEAVGPQQTKLQQEY